MDGTAVAELPIAVEAVPELPKIEDRAGAEAAIARMGVLERDLTLIETTKADDVARVSADAEAKAAPLQAEKTKLAVAVEDYCLRYRKELTGGFRTKTVEFATGKAAWRMGRPRVVIDPTVPLEKIVARLRKLDLSRLVRVREDVDLDAVKAEDKANPAILKKVKGITIEPAKEKFSVEPAGAELVERS